MTDKHETVRELIAFNLKRLRRKHGLTQKELAVKSGCSVGMVQHLETLLKGASDEMLDDLARGFDMHVSELLAPIKPNLQRAALRGRISRVNAELQSIEDELH